MLRLLSILLLLFSCEYAQAKCNITAEAVVGFLDFEIEGCNVVGDLKDNGKGLSGEFTVDLKKLDTDLDLRNDHMKNKYLEVDKYPTAKMVLEQVPYGAKTFAGSLTLHGVTKKVSGKVLKAEKGKLETEFKVNILDFGVEKPGYKGVVIGETVAISVSVP